MKKLLVFFTLLGFVGVVSATMVFNEEGNPLAVMLTDKPCTNPQIVQMIDPEELKNFKSAAVKFDGNPFNACWRVGPEGMTPEPMYFIVDEMGDSGFMPQRMFKEWDGKPGIFGTRI